MRNRENERGEWCPKKVHLTEVEVAELLDMSPRTLQGWRVQGKGPPFEKFGRSVRYNSTALHAWIAAQEWNSTSDAGPACYGGIHRSDNPSVIVGGRS